MVSTYLLHIFNSSVHLVQRLHIYLTKRLFNLWKSSYRILLFDNGRSQVADLFSYFYLVAIFLFRKRWLLMHAFRSITSFASDLPFAKFAISKFTKSCLKIWRNNVTYRAVQRLKFQEIERYIKQLNLTLVWIMMKFTGTS